MNGESVSPELPSVPPVITRKRSTLKKVLWLLIAVCGAILLLVVGVVVFKDNILKAVAEYNVQSKTGMETRIGDLRLGLTSASLMLKNFQVINPKEYGGAPFFTIPEIYMELDQEDARKGVLHFKELRFNLAEVNVVKNKDGKMNLDYMQEALEKAEVLGKTNSLRLEYKFGGIDKMSVTLRSINYIDLQHPGNNSKTDLGVQNEEAKNIKTEEELNKWAVALMAKVALQQMFNPQPQAKPAGGYQTLLDLFNKK
jgi:hypothetical protein